MIDAIRFNLHCRPGECDGCRAPARVVRVVESAADGPAVLEQPPPDAAVRRLCWRCIQVSEARLRESQGPRTHLDTRTREEQIRHAILELERQLDALEREGADETTVTFYRSALATYRRDYPPDGG